MAVTATYYQGSNNGVSSTNKNITGVSWGAGDLVVPVCQTGDNAATVSVISNANLGGTIPAISGFPSGKAGSMRTHAYSAVAASAQTGQTITCTLNTAEPGYSGCFVFAAGTHNGVGAVYHSLVITNGTPPQGTLTGATANSFVGVMVGNWSQAPGTPTYRVDQAGAAVNRVNIDNGTWGSGGLHTHADSGSGTSEIVGWLTPNAADGSISVFEILPAAGPPPQEFLPDADTVTTGWSATPLSTKLADSSDATVVTATLV